MKDGPTPRPDVPTLDYAPPPPARTARGILSCTFATLLCLACWGVPILMFGRVAWECIDAVGNVGGWKSIAAAAFTSGLFLATLYAMASATIDIWRVRSP